MYQLIESVSVLEIQDKMNDLKKQGYKFIDMQATGPGPWTIVVIMYKE